MAFSCINRNEMSSVSSDSIFSFYFVLLSPPLEEEVKARVFLFKEDYKLESVCRVTKMVKIQK